jgi:hypothetical protein
MEKISYSKSQYPVREDFAASHNRYWQRLAAPGSWLTGEQRVDVAKEVRQAQQCSLCRRRKEALSPYQVDGVHDVVSALPEVMVEVVHRVITDPARLTRTWFDDIIRQGLSEEQYVEIIGTLAFVFSIDEFCRCLELPLNELPVPADGEPSAYRPADLSDQGAWVSLIPAIIDSGPESDLWQGRTGYVIRALSLVPDEVRTLRDLLNAHYLDTDTIWDVSSSPKGTLSRSQTEVIAARVSALNGCFY